MSRASLAKLQLYKQRIGWTFPWAPSFGSDFTVNLWFTEAQQHQGDIDYNYRREAPTSDVFRRRAGQEGGGDPAEARFAAMCGTDTLAYHRDRPA